MATGLQTSTSKHNTVCDYKMSPSLKNEIPRKIVHVFVSTQIEWSKIEWSKFVFTGRVCFWINLVENVSHIKTI